MNFKTVHGLGRSDYAIKAINAALDNCQSPHRVDAWLKWFDQQPADNLDGFTAEVSRQCDNCPVTAACPDDCPQPEFYLGDLEEVAAQQTARIEAAVIAMMDTQRDILPARCYRLVKELFPGIFAEIATPGYVEGLLPE